MAASAAALVSVELGGLPRPVGDLLQLRGTTVVATGPALRVTLDTPRGPVTLSTDAAAQPGH